MDEKRRKFNLGMLAAVLTPSGLALPSASAEQQMPTSDFLNYTGNFSGLITGLTEINGSITINDKTVDIVAGQYSFDDSHQLVSGTYDLTVKTEEGLKYEGEVNLTEEGMFLPRSERRLDTVVEKEEAVKKYYQDSGEEFIKKKKKSEGDFDNSDIIEMILSGSYKNDILDMANQNIAELKVVRRLVEERLGVDLELSPAGLTDIGFLEEQLIDNPGLISGVIDGVVADNEMRRRVFSSLSNGGINEWLKTDVLEELKHYEAIPVKVKRKKYKLADAYRDFTRTTVGSEIWLKVPKIFVYDEGLWGANSEGNALVIIDENHKMDSKKIQGIKRFARIAKQAVNGLTNEKLKVHFASDYRKKGWDMPDPMANPEGWLIMLDQKDANYAISRSHRHDNCEIYSAMMRYQPDFIGDRSATAIDGVQSLGVTQQHNAGATLDSKFKNVSPLTKLIGMVKNHYDPKLNIVKDEGVYVLRYIV